MEQPELSNNLQSTKFDNFTREDLIKRQQLLEDEILRLVRELYELRQIKISDEQLKLITAEQLAQLNDALYGASSERYPNIPVREVQITINPIPGCEVCGNKCLILE